MNKFSYTLLILVLSGFLTAGSAMALSLDLTTVGSSGWINEAYFEQIDPQSTGTGVIDPFLRLQASPVEEGFNTDGALLYDQKPGPFTRSLLLTDVPVVNLGGIDYRQFLLDINEAKNENPSPITLYELELYLLATGNLFNYSSLGTSIYDLDGSTDGDSKIELNYALNPGSGAGDMFAYIPDALFTGPNTYVYLSSKFGFPKASEAGFEEWAVLEQGSPVPEPATMILFGLGLVGIAGLGRKTRKK